MTNLVTFVGRLIVEEKTFFNMFGSKKVNQLLIDFDGMPLCYSMNIGYNRKYCITTTTQQDGYRQHIISNSIKFKFQKPSHNGKDYVMIFGTQYANEKFSKNGVKPHASINNCEFVNLNNELCLQIMMSSSRNIFCVTYDKTLFSPEDIIDICGQIITHADI